MRAAIVESLKTEAFLLDPRINVDLVEARPVIVGGEVRRPGSYSFQIGMTVEHAISAAGGLRLLDIDAFNARTQVGALRERLRNTRDELGMALLRRARLTAERSDQAQVAVPKETDLWLTPERLHDGAASENSLLAERASALKGQLEALTSQVAIFQEEIDALTSEDALKVQEAALVKQDALYYDQLVKQGLAAKSSKAIEAARGIVQLQSDRSRIASAIAKAKQEIGRQRQAVLLLKSQRTIELVNALKDTDDAIARLRVTVEELRGSLLNIGEALPSPGSGTATRFVIVRLLGSGMIKMPAQGDTALQPGDLVEVPEH